MFLEYSEDLRSVANAIRTCSQILFQKDLIDTRSGNISVRFSDKIFIKKTGASLPFIEEKDITIVLLSERRDSDKEASSDVELHRKIYIQGDKLEKKYGAVVHTHCPEAVALSLFFEKIIPTDFEAKYFIKEIVSKNYDDIPKYVAKNGIAIAKAHGPFSAGENLEDALFKMLMLSNSLKIEIFKNFLTKCIKESKLLI